MRVAYDIETFPNCFILCAEHVDLPVRWCFEISDHQDDSAAIMDWCRWILESKGRMVGFNNVGFDYPVLHVLLRAGKATAATLYSKAMQIIKGQDEDRFAHMVFPSDRMIEQLDLFKIHHFDNKARTTSLKALEYQMRMENISDLPFPVGTVLNQDQIAILKTYCAHDVTATKLFYHQSLEQIRFREELIAKHGRDFMNHNDTKIGAEIFQMELERVGVQCYEYGKSGRAPRQTKRESIALKDCVPQWITFINPEFDLIKDFFNAQIVTETKGVFKDVVATVAGLKFVYGSGGLHASVENQSFVADDEWMIYDMDVTSLYPSIAIEHGHYPEHLGSKFVDVYRQLRTQRIGYKKGTAENAMLKLALNGVYGKSNDKFSIFFDPLFTMKITIGGQMMISKLVEMLLGVDSVHICQCNTDGVTVWMRRDAKMFVDMVCQQWQEMTKLSLEYVEYKSMTILNVNNYIAEDTKGKVKRKGCFEYDKEWHQDSSALVVPKVVEQVLIHGAPIRETVIGWPDMMDFMIRVKVPRSSKLIYSDEHKNRQVENIQRYYISKEGGKLFKVMPPLKGQTADRWFDVQKDRNVCICNDIKDAVLPVEYEWYIEEVRKLCLS